MLGTLTIVLQYGIPIPIYGLNRDESAGKRKVGDLIDSETKTTLKRSILYLSPKLGTPFFLPFKVIHPPHRFPRDPASSLTNM